MTRTMYDSVTATDIPADAEMVAGYVDRKKPWTAADWARFPGVPHIRIATRASTTGNGVDVLDVERGDATPAQAPGWINTQRALGYHRPTIYCPASLRAQVVAACDQNGPHLVAGRDYDLWIARYRASATTPPHNEPGAAATQYANADTSGGHYDLSLVADDGWPHRTDSPTPTPPGANMKNWKLIVPTLDDGKTTHNPDGSTVDHALLYNPDDGYWTTLGTGTEADQCRMAGAVDDLHPPLAYKLFKHLTNERPR